MEKVENCDFSRIVFLVFVLDLDGLSAGEALVVPKKALVHLIKCLHLLYEKRQYYVERTQNIGKIQSTFPTSPLYD